jgi:hypothetical protein
MFEIYSEFGKSLCTYKSCWIRFSWTILSKSRLKQLHALPVLHFNRCLTNEYSGRIAHLNDNFDTHNQIYVPQPKCTATFRTHCIRVRLAAEKEISNPLHRVQTGPGSILWPTQIPWEAPFQGIKRPALEASKLPSSRLAIRKLGAKQSDKKLERKLSTLWFLVKKVSNKRWRT